MYAEQVARASRGEKASSEDRRKLSKADKMLRGVGKQIRERRLADEELERITITTSD